MISLLQPFEQQHPVAILMLQSNHMSILWLHPAFFGRKALEPLQQQRSISVLICKMVIPLTVSHFKPAIVSWSKIKKVIMKNKMEFMSLLVLVLLGDQAIWTVLVNSLEVRYSCRKVAQTAIRGIFAPTMVMLLLEQRQFNLRNLLGLDRSQQVQP